MSYSTIALLRPPLGWLLVSCACLAACSSPNDGPFQVCRISFGRLGMEYAACIGTLISPNRLLTEARCDTGTSHGKSAQATCGDETRTVELKAKREDPADRSFETMNAARESLGHSLAIYEVHDGPPFSKDPVILDFRNDSKLDECSLVRFGLLQEVLNSGPSSTDLSGAWIHFFGSGESLIISKKINDDTHPGVPLFCKSPSGEYWLKAIKIGSNSDRQFYARVDKNKDFIDPYLR